jgi:quinoprotein glucose dehydrogenase
MVRAFTTAFLLMIAVCAAQQERTSAQGQTARSVWDGVYASTQAERGKTAFESYCAGCHSSDLTGGSGPALSGAPFMQRWDFRNVNQLFTEMKTRMPRNDPSSLVESTYLDIVTYILKANAFPAGSEELKPAADLLGSIRIERTKTSDRPAELRTGMLVQVIGCLTQGANGWMLAKATAPIRTENPDASKGDERTKLESMPLGTQSFQLLGIFSPLDDQKDHKMEGKGFLVKDPSGDRINVATLEPISANCAQ